jgi:hypothetical protein
LRNKHNARPLTIPLARKDHTVAKPDTSPTVGSSGHQAGNLQQSDPGVAARRRFWFPIWGRDIRVWQLSVAALALLSGIGLYVLRSYQETAQRSVAITAEMFVDPKSGYTDGVSWPVVISIMNDGPAEGKDVSAHLLLVNPKHIRHASPMVIDKPAGTSVEVSEHGHGDDYVINLKNLVPKTIVVIAVEFQAESENVKQEFIEKFKRNPLSVVFLAEFVKELSFSGENVTSEINVNAIDRPAPISEWNGYEVLRNARHDTGNAYSK